MRVFLAGHNGMVGSHMRKILEDKYNHEVVTADRDELNLVNQSSVKKYFLDQKFDMTVIAAARVGGIHANNEYPAEFIYENLMIQSNLIHYSHLADVNQLLFLGSSCIYPKLSQQPMHEKYLLCGYLEPTNEPYAIAKIAGIKMCESYNRQYGRDYRSVMPTNLYGPNDNFHNKNSHVIPALMRRMHEAKLNKDKDVEIWGDGSSKREFLHVEDMAQAAIHVSHIKKPEFNTFIEDTISHINVGYGDLVSIKDLSYIIKDVVGYEGNIVFDKSKPNGAPVKLLDSSKLFAMNWKPSIDLRSGLETTYSWFLDNVQDIRN